MSRLDEAPALEAGPEKSLADLPLRREAGESSVARLAAEAPAIARLPSRVGAFAADVATIVLFWAAAILAASLARGEAPHAAGLPWAAAFLLLLSFFATVPALLFFGKTVGMALAGLAACPGDAGRRLSWDEALLRWLGTLAVVATLGTALLWTAPSDDAPTPADLLSGRALVEEEP